MSMTRREMNEFERLEQAVRGPLSGGELRSTLRQAIEEEMAAAAGRAAETAIADVADLRRQLTFGVIA